MQVLLADDHLMVREALIPFIEQVAVNTTKEKSRLRAQRFVTGDKVSCNREAQSGEFKNMVANGSVTAIRGAVLTFTDNPFRTPVEDCMLHESDAVIIMADNKVSEFGFKDLLLG